jgi:hypothetical protein
MNDEIVLEENELSTSLFPPSFQEEEDFSTEPKTDPSFVKQAMNDKTVLEERELSRSPFFSLFRTKTS